MKFSLLFLPLLLAAVPTFAGGKPAPATDTWRVKTSPHFVVYHESAWSPSAIMLELERMYSTVRLNMAMFAPWMTTEKSKVYIYSSEATYLAGEFSPPRWSKGLAFPSKKTVVVYDSGDKKKLKAVLAHELSHLYFEGYFAEKLKYPPQWLNEGLAVHLEDQVFQQGGPWRLALAYFPSERRYPFAKFFGAELEKLGSTERISDWYLQAFGTVSFLYQPQNRLQFRNYCSLLREGVGEEDAFWKVYRIKDVRDLDLKWNAWVEGYGQTLTAASGNGSSRSGDFTFKPMRISSFPFTPFGAKP